MTSDARQIARFEALYQRGTELLHRKQPAEAIGILEKARALDPEHAGCALNLSGAYILIGKFRQAVPILEQLSEREPNNAMIWTNLGAAYLGNPLLATDEQQRQAIQAFEQALQVDPAAPHVAYNLGLIYRDRQERDKARFWFGQAVQANPNDRDAHKLLQRLSHSETSE
jgi:tetratricopeptide (TPR) repeat protein